jgi:glucan 1,3-beta-glucosidase
MFAKPLHAVRAVLALLALVLLVAMVSAVQRGRPVELPEAGPFRLHCVSYAPFRRPGETPFDEKLRITPEAIEADLRLLASVTGCVRTYGLDHGLDAVPAIARTLGLKVLLGAWIGRDPAANTRQLQRALELAREFKDVVQLLIVGNEVLLRGELAPPALAALLAEARRASPVPVAYADVWAFWQRHRTDLLPSVDVVAAHILPYWEDEPVDNALAAGYVRRMAADLRAEFAPTHVYVAETGWPAAGRQRGPAMPGRLEQARFVRQLVADGSLDFNLIEGFDQPWKRRLEGAMGGAWGLFDSAGAQRVPSRGPIVPDPAWYAPLLGALGGGMLLALFGGRPRRALGAAAPGALMVGGGLVGFFAVPQILSLPLWSRDLWEWARNLAMLGVVLAAGSVAAARLAELAQKHQGICQPSTSDARWRAIVQTVLLACVVLEAFWLAIDGRYRPLPWPSLVAPALLFAALAALGDRLPARRGRRLLALLAGVLAVAVVAGEGPGNGEALRYAGLAVLLALASF